MLQSIRCGLLLQIAWSVCVSLCLSVGHDHEPYDNGPADRNAIWGVYFRAQGTMYTMEARIPERKGHFGGGQTYPELARSRYSGLNFIPHGQQR